MEIITCTNKQATGENKFDKVIRIIFKDGPKSILEIHENATIDQETIHEW